MAAGFDTTDCHDSLRRLTAMTRSPIAATEHSAPRWFICDSTERWRRTAQRFLSRSKTPWRNGSPREIRNLASQPPGAIVLWGFSLGTDEEMLESLRLLSRLPNPPLQFVGLPGSIDPTETTLSQVQWYFRQLGAAFVITAPENFTAAIRLAERFQTTRRHVSPKDC